MPQGSNPYVAMAFADGAAAVSVRTGVVRFGCKLALFVSGWSFWERYAMPEHKEMQTIAWLMSRTAELEGRDHA